MGSQVPEQEEIFAKHISNEGQLSRIYRELLKQQLKKKKK